MIRAIICQYIVWGRGDKEPSPVSAVFEITVMKKEADYEKTGTASRNCCGNAVALVDDHFAGSSNAPFLCAEHEYDDNAPQAGL